MKLVADKNRQPIRLRQRCPACSTRMVHECTQRRWLCVGCGAWGVIWPKPWRTFTRHERILFREQRRKIELIVRGAPATFGLARRRELRRDQLLAERQVREVER